MRVFVALASPQELYDVAREYQQLVADVEGVRILKPDALHMTVIRPWEEGKPQAVLNDFRAITAHPVKLTMNRIRYRESRGGISLVLECSEDSETLRKLWLQTWRALWSQDAPEVVTQHITLARFPIDADLPILAPVEPVTAVFDKLCLYESLGNLEYQSQGEKLLK